MAAATNVGRRRRVITPGLRGALPRPAPRTPLGCNHRDRFVGRFAGRVSDLTPIRVGERGVGLDGAAGDAAVVVRARMRTGPRAGHPPSRAVRAWTARGDTPSSTRSRCWARCPRPTSQADSDPRSARRGYQGATRLPSASPVVLRASGTSEGRVVTSEDHAETTAGADVGAAPKGTRDYSCGSHPQLTQLVHRVVAISALGGIAYLAASPSAQLGIAYGTTNALWASGFASSSSRPGSRGLRRRTVQHGARPDHPGQWLRLLRLVVT